MSEPPGNLRAPLTAHQHLLRRSLFAPRLGPMLDRVVTPDRPAPSPSSRTREIRYHLRPSDWLQTEWPALIWLAIALTALTSVVAAALLASAWFALLLVPALALARRGLAIAMFLLTGGHEVVLRVEPTGAIFASERGSAPVHAHWRELESHPQTFVLWGADGRYRLVIPRAALGPEDEAAIRAAMHVAYAAAVVSRV